MAEKYYVTTPIYYVNDYPHLGHAYTTVAADVMARYKRLQGADVFFATGTDEHGLKIERSASAKEKHPQQFVDEVAEVFRETWRKLNISNDDFIRTSEERHKKVALDIFKKAFDAGDIYKDKYEGWYCTSDENYLLESDLIDGTCPNCKAKAEWIVEEAYFFRLSKYQDWILDHIDKNPDFIRPVSRKNEVVSFVSSGLRDLCVSRSTFTWGIPLPFDEGQVLYVWLDALTNYISVIGYGTNSEMFERYWPADVHIVGKEILRFHAVIWPIMLRAAGLEPPRSVFAHGWWTVEGEKMSKSKGNVIKPYILAEKLSALTGTSIEVAVDAVRYFLLREVPFGLDGDFSLASFNTRFSADLANDFGNLLNRTLAQIERNFDGVVPEQAENATPAHPADAALMKEIASIVKNAQVRLDAMEFSRALAETWKIFNITNKYIDDQAPWGLMETDKVRAGTILFNVLNAVRIASFLIFPFMPTACRRVLEQLGVADSFTLTAGRDGFAEWSYYRGGNPILKGEPIFPRPKKGEKVVL